MTARQLQQLSAVCVQHLTVGIGNWWSGAGSQASSAGRAAAAGVAERQRAGGQQAEAGRAGSGAATAR
eukprot:14486345-Alexandrium_andersonii.AAC.1